jgi:hypothetical protein
VLSKWAVGIVTPKHTDVINRKIAIRFCIRK